MPAGKRAVLMYRWARLFKRPVEGTGATFIWSSLSSQHYYNSNIAAAIYRKIGYKPFSGYPLTRSN
jgi:hypothetical protein